MSRFPLLLAVFCLSCEKPQQPQSQSTGPAQNALVDDAGHSPLSQSASAQAQESTAPENTRRSDPETAGDPPGVPGELPPNGDRGIFSDLDEQVSLSCPPWLSDAPWITFVVDVPGKKQSGALAQEWQSWRGLGGVPLCSAAKNADPVIRFSAASELATSDRDEDGLPDSIDILRGAKKTVLNGAAYRGGYHTISFPGGDVPRDQGVCTDVIVRALRNAGFDLQALVADDIKTRPAAYPMVTRADTNIDHRRVRTLLPYFEQHFTPLPTEVASGSAPFFPGDILFMNTLGDAAPEHMGIVSDQLGKSGLPLIINNWTDGTKTAEMDLLTFVPVTHRFRVAGALPVPPSHQGLEGLLSRSQLKIPADTRQAVSVVTTLWSSPRGSLARWKRASPSSPWVREDEPSAAVLGRAGLGQGRGLGSPSLAPHKKIEGDKRSPAGVFALGTAFGRAPVSPYAGSYPYRPVEVGDYWVDDPHAPEYNTWQRLSPGRQPPWSAEQLTIYRLGLVVEHNTSPIKSGAGSAIFIHPWQSEGTPTVGCTGIPLSKLQTLLGWLDLKQKPVLVQTAGHLF